MSEDNRSGTCVSGKVRYADEENAATALERVRVARALRPDGNPPERVFYYCPRCEGWHLSSKPPELHAEHLPKGDGETWEEYAHRLERRIKEQRDQLESLNELRADAGNRAERKRIARLHTALGRMTEDWEREREQKHGLVSKVLSQEVLLEAFRAEFISTCLAQGDELQEACDCVDDFERDHASRGSSVEEQRVPNPTVAGSIPALGTYEDDSRGAPVGHSEGETE